mgnify:CR=1 FL=1
MATTKEELQKEMEKLERLHGADYETKAVDAVKESMRKMLNSGDPKKEQTAASLYSLAANDYAIGGQDYEEAFP